MADKNKTIRIDYRADMSQLLAELRQMPGVTEKEAKKMVSELSRQMKKTEKAAASAAKKNAQAMKKMEAAAQETGSAYKTLRRDAANVDRIFGEMAVALDNVHPALGAMAFAASDAASGLEAMGRVITGMNPVFLAILGTATAIGAAFLLMSDDAEELAEATKEARIELAELATVAGSLDGDLNRARAAFAAFQGAIDDLDLASLQAEMDIRSAAQEKIDAQEKRISLLKTDLSILEKASTVTAALTDDEEARLKIMAKTHTMIDDAAQIEAAWGNNVIKTAADRQTAQAALRRAIAEETEEKTRLVELMDEAVALSDQQFATQQAQRAAAEAARAAEERQHAAAEAHAQAQAAAAAAERTEAKEAANLDQKRAEVQRMIRAATGDTLTAAERLRQTYADQLFALQAIEDTHGGQVATASAQAALQLRLDRDLQAERAKIAEYNKKIADEKQNEELGRIQTRLENERLNMRELRALAAENIAFEGEAKTKLHELIMAQLHERKQEIISGSKIALSSAIQATELAFSALETRRREAVAEMTATLEDQDNNLTKSQEKNLRKKRDAELKALNKAFRIRQAASMAEVTMSTASAIMQAYAQLGPVGGSIAAAGLAALGGVQIGVIAAEKPPAFHRGGMVRQADPGEVPARLRPGEGVLTRQGVAAIGGGDALDEANRGAATRQASPPTVVQLVMSGQVIESAIQTNQRRGGSLSAALVYHAPAGRSSHYRGA